MIGARPLQAYWTLINTFIKLYSHNDINDSHVTEERKTLLRQIVFAILRYRSKI